MTDDELTLMLCTLLGSLPGWVWATTGEYGADDVGVFYGAIAASPDQAVGVRVYATDDRAGLRERRVQFRIRGRGRAGANRLADILFGVLHGLSRTGGISDARRISMAPAGVDGNGREERTDNYLVTLDNSEAAS